MANRKERIAKGIEFLDKKAPGWCDKVDLEVLDLGSSYLCVLGQVFNKQAKRSRICEDGFDFGSGRLPSTASSSEYGFNMNYEKGEEYFPLTQAWKRAIRAHCHK